MSLDHQALEAMLNRLQLTAIRDQLDTLLDEAAKRELRAQWARTQRRVPIRAEDLDI
jgi:ABC-type phosphate transport system auxiliary subunit